MRQLSCALERMNRCVFGPTSNSVCLVRISITGLIKPLHDLCCSAPISVSVQWINSRTLVLVDSHEKLQVVDRPSQEILETLDLEQVQLVYNSRHFKSLATGGNVSQALVRD